MSAWVVPWSEYDISHFHGSESHIYDGQITAIYHFGGSWSHNYWSYQDGSKKSERLKTSNRNIQKMEGIRIHLLAVFKASKTAKSHAAAKKNVVAGKNLPYALAEFPFILQLVLFKNIFGNNLVTLKQEQFQSK